MEIRQYLEPLLKWWKFILAACILAGLSSFVFVRQQPATYQTRTTLVIGRAVYEANPSGGEFNLATQLSNYYADLAKRDVIRNAAKLALGMTWLPEYTTRTLPNSQLVEIIVTDTDPRRAQAVANELANQLILQTPSYDASGDQQRQVFVESQLALLESQILDTQEQIAGLEAKLGGLKSARQITDTQSEINTLNQKLLTLQTNYATLLRDSGGRATNTLSILEPATTPVASDNSMVIVLSVAVAFVVTSGAAYAIEFLDDTIKSEEDITRLLNLPILGVIYDMAKESEKGLYTLKNPRSAISESFRVLRTNLDFVEIDLPSKAILMVSSDQDQGKSVVASNLAIVMAQGGKKVYLLDCDLHQPSIHTFHVLFNNIGISDVFRGALSLDDVTQESKAECLSVITSGSLMPNPADLLGSKKMNTIIHDLKQRADIVIVDGPPVLVADAALLATKVDVCLLVVGHGLTHKSAAVAALKQLQHVGAKVAGVVYNRVPTSNKRYGYYYTN